MTGAIVGTRLLDYLAFSVKDYGKVSGVCEALGLEFADLGHGMGPWRSAAGTSDRAAFLFSDNIRRDAEPSWFFDLRGGGMRAVEMCEGFVGWREKVAELCSLGVEFKRVDACVDDTAGVVSMDVIEEAVRAGHVLRKGDSWQVIERNSNLGRAKTVYVGSRQSSVMLRAYNKGRQLGEGRDWVRLEFEIKQERAEAWCRLLVSEGWDAAYAALRGSIDFRVPSGDSNKSRWPVARWWAEAISESRAVLHVSRQAVASISRKMDHIRKQCCKSIALVTEAGGGAVDWLYDVIEDGRSRYKKADRDLLQRFKMHDWLLNAFAAGDSGGNSGSLGRLQAACG